MTSNLSFKSCKKGKLVSNEDWDDKNMWYPISTELDEFLCPKCKVHHIICEKCEKNGRTVFCQYLGHTVMF